MEGVGGGGGARRVECPVRWKLIAEHIDMTWRKITSRNEIDFGAINRPQPHSHSHSHTSDKHLLDV